MAKTSGSGWLIGLGAGGLIGVALGLLVSTSCHAEENVMRVDVPPAYARHDLVAIAQRYQGMTAHQIGLPSRLWCGDFVNYVRRKAGIDAPKSRRAFDQAKAGKRIHHPVVGAVFIIPRGKRGGHTGLVAAVNADGTITTIEGNVSGRVVVRNRRLVGAIYIEPT